VVQALAINRDGEETVGARSISAPASIFLLIADCDALAGTSLGSGRGKQLLMSGKEVRVRAAGTKSEQRELVFPELLPSPRGRPDLR